jgi:uncharacterized OB-fold protein
MFTGGIKMTEAMPHTIEQFYRFIAQEKMMATKCSDCDEIYVLPRFICAKCLSRNLVWVEIGKTGRLLTYTIIYIAPPKFQEDVPYVYGIAELDNGLRLPGVVRQVSLDQVKIGMKLEVGFDIQVDKEWPRWPRYFFRPASKK